MREEYESEFYQSVRSKNQVFLMENSAFQNSLNEIWKLWSFISGYRTYIVLGRDFVWVHDVLQDPLSDVYSLQTFLRSAELTIGSIISCCESGCMADANCLVRKYRDDMLFCVYIAVLDANRRNHDTSEITKQMEHNFEEWAKNSLKRLDVFRSNKGSKRVVDSIIASPVIQAAEQSYGLKDFLGNLNQRLNNYVHGNGIDYYNGSILQLAGRAEKQIEEIVKDLYSITTTVLFMLALCSPAFLASTDYSDYLDVGMTPPEGSQYWVAPVINDFFKENIDTLKGDINCIEFLKNTMQMEFD